MADFQMVITVASEHCLRAEVAPPVYKIPMHSVAARIYSKIADFGVRAFFQIFMHSKDEGIPNLQFLMLNLCFFVCYFWLFYPTNYNLSK